MLGFITENARRSFRQLPDALRNSFQHHGITPEDWELIRKTPKWRDPETRAEFIGAEDVVPLEAGAPLSGERGARSAIGGKADVPAT